MLNGLTFDAVNIFAVNHLLFPEQNVNRIKAAFMPGDMVVFGDITASLTSLNVTPLTGTVAAGQSLQFRAGAGVTWSLSPEDAGSISDTGLYQAPPVIDSALVNVKITATGSDGATSSAYVAVVPLPAMISPAFVALKEVTGSLGDPAVSGTDDEPVYTVTYTSPDTVSQDELVIVTVRSEDAATRAGYAVVDVAGTMD
ncbi:hypothetical protein IFU37_023155 (plasmid) [Pantoea agglomerans]|uniref:hypothetical protein n=1 Tax=Enterobacter agglomerans TaxID=549 RepID=UPI002ED50C88|nr:hypothetical protein IFU37_023155 [Pantoea agglomerans]